MLLAQADGRGVPEDRRCGPRRARLDERACSVWAGRPFFIRIGVSHASGGAGRAAPRSPPATPLGSRSSMFVSISRGSAVVDPVSVRPGPRRRGAGRSRDPPGPGCRHPRPRTRRPSAVAGRTPRRASSAARRPSACTAPWPPCPRGSAPCAAARPPPEVAPAGRRGPCGPCRNRRPHGETVTSGPEVHEARAHADHVGDRVQRADLVEVHGLGSVPWTITSATARRSNAASARSRTRPSSAAASTIVRTSRQVRLWGTRSGRRGPERRRGHRGARARRGGHGLGATASTAACSTSTGTPAPTSAEEEAAARAGGRVDPGDGHGRSGCRAPTGGPRGRRGRRRRSRCRC